ncbi:MAG: hypothetical protein DI596_03830 [Azospira oryzae]|nr:MAG: hypothetical protein DI596_03830 [Azospira oryzae]PZP81609.1 MAG: hypothetical protein DI593_03830 [Azospira oryzae]
MDRITNQPRPGIEIVDAAELLASPAPQIDWLVHGLIPLGTVGDVFGPPGDGKSTIVMDLALSISSGAGSWFGLRCASGQVVILGGERSGKDALARDLHRAAQGRRPDRGMLLFPCLADADFPPMWRWDRQAQEWCATDWCQALTAWLAASPPVLVIIDTLLSVASGLDVLDVSQGYSLGQTIRRWARDLGGPTVLTVSHTSQAMARDELPWRLHWLSRQGSSGFPGAVRWAAGVSRIKDDDELAKVLGLAERAREGGLVALGVSKHNEMPRPVWNNQAPAIFHQRADGSLLLVKDGREVSKALSEVARETGRKPKKPKPEKELVEVDYDDIPF